MTDDRAKINDNYIEQTILGTMLDDNTVIGEILMKTSPEAFYTLQNQQIYNVIVALYMQGYKADIITVIQKLQSIPNDVENLIGYISGLTNFRTFGNNVNIQVELLNEMYKRRIGISMLDTLQNDLNDKHKNMDDIIKSMTDFQNMILNFGKTNQVKTLKFCAEEYEKKLLDRPKSIKTYFSNLDFLLHGFHAGELTIIAARPSIGKTAFCLNLMLNQTTRDETVAFFSLEMSIEQLIEREISMTNDGESVYNSMKNHDYINKDGTEKKELQQVKNILEKLKTHKVYISETPNAKISEILAKSKDLVLNKGCRAIYIDYIGLIDSEESSNVPEHQRIGDVSKKLKQLARELNVPVICCSQLNRDAANKEPDLSQMKGSGSIEQDADIAILIHGHISEVDETGKEKNEISRKIIVAKNRNGNTGICKFTYVRNRLLFREVFE